MARILTRRRTSSGRRIIETRRVGVLDIYGRERKYGRYSTGGSSMLAILGPDAGGGQKDTDLAVIAQMNLNSPLTWKAGHLLNGELGGDGKYHPNLTPLTDDANRNHATYEQHIKAIITTCKRFDDHDRSLELDFWFGVMYRIDVSDICFATNPSKDDWHSYAYSHITIQYSIVRIYKNSRKIEFADDDDIDKDLKPPHQNLGALEIHNRVRSDRDPVLQWPRRNLYPLDPNLFDTSRHWFF